MLIKTIKLIVILTILFILGLLLFTVAFVNATGAEPASAFIVGTGLMLTLGFLSAFVTVAHSTSKGGK